MEQRSLATRTRVGRFALAAVASGCAMVSGGFHARATSAPIEPAQSAPLFRNTSFEELANVSVVSVTRTPQPYFTTAAAIHVLSKEEVRRGGYQNIPQALRTVPGMAVGQANAYTWSVAARGFNSLFVDKLLVLVDGRSIYTPLWSGVYWEDQWLDNDLDRIEVIRGPGASVWGANAVNGVVNVLSRSARETQGVAATATVGTEVVSGSIRYGQPIAADGAFRVYADVSDYDDSVALDGSAGGDAWSSQRAGLRYDGGFGASSVMVKSEWHASDFEQPGYVPAALPPYVTMLPEGHSEGGYLQTQWLQRLDSNSELTIDAWYERLSRDLRASRERRATYDAELRYRTQRDRHDVAVGVEYRHIQDENEASFILALTPPMRTLRHLSAFAQDAISLREDDAVILTLGAKVEETDSSNWEIQPSARLSVQVSADDVIWASVGRAVRTPSRINEDGVTTAFVIPPGQFGPGSPAVLRQTVGNRAVDPEDLVAYEVGWRSRFAGRFTLDVAAFYNDYRNLVSLESAGLDTQTLAPDYWRMLFEPTNAGSGRSYGAELTTVWQVNQVWRLQGAYSWLDMALTPASSNLSRLEGASPQQQLTLRSSVDIARWQFDVSLRYVDELPELLVADYVGADIRLAREIGHGMEIAVIGQNLWDERRTQFRSSSVPLAAQIERSALLRLSWRR